MKVILLLMLLAQPQDGLPQHPSEINAPALRSYSARELKSDELPGGAELLVIEDDSLPIVDGTLVFRVGSVFDPLEKTGLTALAADCMREGGSQTSSGAELDAWLDLRAATLELIPAEETLTLRFSCAAEDLKGLFERVLDLLRRPSFPVEALESGKQRALTLVTREEDDAASFADALLLEVAYGSTSPWARRPTRSTISAVSREDLLAWHETHIGPNRLVVGVTGDVSATQILEHLSTLFEGWESAPVPEAISSPVFSVPARTTIYLYDRPGRPQTELRFAGPGLLRLHPDYAPLLLWSDVVGIGGSTNRMMVRLRTELGLAYSVGAYFRPGWEHSGRLIGYIGTRNDAAATALASMLQILQESTDPFGEAEFSDALERHRNAEVFQLDTPHKVLDRAMLLVLHKYPEDFWDKNWSRLAKLDTEMVAAAARRHIDADRLVVVAVGPAEVLEPALEELGEVIRLDRDPEAADPTEWLDRLFGAVGSRSVWAGADGVEYVSEISGLPVGSATARSHTWVSFLHASSRTVTQQAGSETTMVIGPRAGWARTSTTISEFPEEICERVRASARSNLYRILKVLAETSPDELSLDEEGRLAGLLANGERFLMEIGEAGYPETLTIQSGGEESVKRFYDWTPVAGISYAKRSIRMDGTQLGQHLSEFVLHQELDPELFKRP